MAPPGNWVIMCTLDKEKEAAMAKGQMRKPKEAKKPKKNAPEKAKAGASSAGLTSSKKA